MMDERTSLWFSVLCCFKEMPVIYVSLLIIENQPALKYSHLQSSSARLPTNFYQRDFVGELWGGGKHT